MKFSAVTLVAAVVFATTAAALPTDMQALQALQEREAKGAAPKAAPKKAAPKKAAPKKSAPKKPAPKKSEPKKSAPPPKKDAPKASGIADKCGSKKDGTFNTKWLITSRETMSGPKDYLGKGFVDNLRGQWQFGQIVQPCNPIDYQAIPTNGGATFHFDTSNECGGWQIAAAFKAARGDHLTIYCEDNLGEAISGDVGFGMQTLQTVGEVAGGVAKG